MEWSELYLPGTVVIFSSPPGRTTTRERSLSIRFSFWSMVKWGFPGYHWEKPGESSFFSPGGDGALLLVDTLLLDKNVYCRLFSVALAVVKRFVLTRVARGGFILKNTYTMNVASYSLDNILCENQTAWKESFIPQVFQSMGAITCKSTRLLCKQVTRQPSGQIYSLGLKKCLWVDRHVSETV